MNQVNLHLENDPELEQIENYFADEVISRKIHLTDKQKWYSLLAICLGCQAVDVFASLVEASLNAHILPISIREVVYQANDYLGLARVYPFLGRMNEVFSRCGIALPLENQSTVDSETRLEKGIQAQVAIFGPAMKDFYQSGPEDSRHINRYLAENCFGDFYTRKGLDFQERELVTFCYLYAQGGCEPQLIAHAKANLANGNTKDILLDVITLGIPYIGYPRTLNALRCINEACK